MDRYVTLIFVVAGIGGTASVSPLRAVLKAERTSPRTSTNVSIVHVRPLYTAGDLMLALFELMDSQLFSRGYVQLAGDLGMRDTTDAWSQEVNIFRVTYRVGKPNKWTYLIPSKIFDLRNQDLPPFLCPHLCPQAFTSTPVPSAMETVEMKAWMSNFVRSYKLVHGLSGAEPYLSKGISIAKNGGSLQSLTLDVQLVRHVEDAYLYSSQVRRPTKAELRKQVPLNL